MAPPTPSLPLSCPWQKDQLFLVRAGDAIRACRGDGYEKLSPIASRLKVLDAWRWNAADVRDFVDRGHLSAQSLVGCPDGLLFDRLRALIEDGLLVVIHETANRATDERQKQRQVLRDLQKAMRGGLKFEGRNYRLVADYELGRIPNRDDYAVVNHAEAVRVLTELAKVAPAGLARVLIEARDQLARDWRPPMYPQGLVLLKHLVVLKAPIKVEEPTAPRKSPGQTTAEAAVEEEEEALPPCVDLAQAKQASVLVQASREGTPFCEQCERPSVAGR